jgi:PAS domain S-box-containing protein
VIAVDQHQRITTFNREAQRITGFDPADVLGQHADSLPPALAEAFQHVFETGTEQHDVEVVLEAPEHSEVPIRLGSSLFRGHTGQILGAIVLFNDMTRIRALELLVRRSDRLASIGTLSAGMAHEIKNPLVTIKTFTQLLPERYMDEDFRVTFSDLISHEVDRIDSIVNQLLHFSRPAKPLLEPKSLHEIVQASLRLLHEQLRQHNIHLVADIDAEQDIIRADVDLLTQALINFVLNAIQAMGSNGTLTISTRNAPPTWAAARDIDGEASTAFILLDIRDTGAGIPEENLSHIFDPFFTTKAEGTGLGLSVAHGIVTDHHGTLDVESEPGDGTVFHLYFPVHQEAAVAS